MKIHKKIQKIMAENGLTLKEIDNRQKLFYEKPLSSNAIKKIIEGDTFPRYTSLLKLCPILGISLMELMKDTELDDICLIPKDIILNSYTYQNGVQLKYVTSPTSPFLTGVLALKPGEKTTPEQSPVVPDIKYEKNITVMKGRLKVFIDNAEYSVLDGGSITFNSSQIHYFENKHNRLCKSVIVLYPKHF